MLRICRKYLPFWSICLPAYLQADTTMSKNPLTEFLRNYELCESINGLANSPKDMSKRESTLPATGGKRSADARCGQCALSIFKIGGLSRGHFLSCLFAPLTQ